MSAPSTTQTVWQWLDCGAFPPPKAAACANAHSLCWLCGALAGDDPWRHKDAIAPTFTDYAEAACLGSDIVCQACVALSRSEGWAQVVRAYPDRGFSDTFPPNPGKKPRAFNWLYMSHVFTPKYHQTPSRAEWRGLLVDPPLPPFVAVLAQSGKKQLIFKARINHSRTRFSVQTDDRQVWVEPTRFAACLADFEALYRLGFSKRQVATGAYAQSKLSEVGLRRWRPLEAQMKPWRQAAPEYVMLAEFCGQKEDTPA